MTTKRFQYRAYPTPAQEPALARAFGCARVVYNDALHARETAHANGLTYPKLAELSQRLTEAKKTPERAWLGEVSAVVLQQALADADRAYRNFFQAAKNRKANGGKGRFVGKPRFKSKKNARQAVRYTRNSRFKIRVVNRERALLTLPGVPGEVMFRLSRRLPSNPSSVTVVGEADGRYYVSFVVETPAKQPLPESSRHVALDLGLVDFAAVVATDGTRDKIANPRFLRAAQRRLAHHQRALARKEKDSKNRAKARAKVTAAHRKVREARLDHAHNLALRLVSENQTITVEALNVRGLARSGAKGRRGAGLRRSVHDAGWGQFLRVLTVKAAEYGRSVLAVDPAYTSQSCGVCGRLDGPKPLSVRVWTCAGCGTTLDRDYNAATNILVAAGQTTGLAPVAETLNACGGVMRPRLAAADPGEAGTRPWPRRLTLASNHGNPRRSRRGGCQARVMTNQRERVQVRSLGAS
ncbi:RNA-guided endonuclease InsQ/TnpB family protein [Planosporangium mesophilum]|uniref:Transposase n=1 Tax=Planosporangium mesophilum TaxID=689768 RepID=A0A8J3T9I9_9ACTN|nr:RNA-guided endonuclease TnpB family protein [Planosporangium mesophilum]GII23050.1 transposase [Planosporangium mesophilum]